MAKKKLIPYGAIRSQLRRLWLYSDQRKACLTAARVSRGKYRCAKCNELFGPKEVQVDHIIEIGKLISWDDWITKLFCDVSNLQVLCKSCHLAKTFHFRTLLECPH